MGRKLKLGRTSIDFKNHKPFKSRWQQVTASEQTSKSKSKIKSLQLALDRSLSRDRDIRRDLTQLRSTIKSQRIMINAQRIDIRHLRTTIQILDSEKTHQLIALNNLQKELSNMREHKIQNFRFGLNQRKLEIQA